MGVDRVIDLISLLLWLIVRSTCGTVLVGIFRMGIARRIVRVLMMATVIVTKRRRCLWRGLNMEVLLFVILYPAKFRKAPFRFIVSKFEVKR